MKKDDTPAPAFEKEVVHLPDGRELTYYRFPEPKARPAEEDPPSASGKER